MPVFQARHETHGRYRKVHRYSSARRDMVLSVLMLVFGLLVIGGLLWLILGK